jgi:colanic acid biosynthesis glycosyl transferase WcaI
LVPMRKVPLFEGRLPLKTFEIMACARPILLGVEGEARRLAEQEAGAAIYVEPENTGALVAGILYIQGHPEEAELLGLRGRAYVEARFDRDQLTAELDVHIAKVLGKEMPIPPSVADMPEPLPNTPIPRAIAEESRTY